MPDSKFQVKYNSWSALARDFKQQISLSGFFIKTNKIFPQFSPVSLQFIAPDAAALELPSEVLQVIAGRGIAVQIKDSTREAIEHIQRLIAAHPEALASSPQPDDPVITDVSLGSLDLQRPSSMEQRMPSSMEQRMPSSMEQQTPGFINPLLPNEAEAAEIEEPSEMIQSQTLLQQIEKMSVNEKRAAALHGQRDMRLMLIRDRNKTIHPFVVKNPAITLDEIEQIAKMPGVNPDVLHQISQNRDWTRSTTVCRNLVRNPKTPLKDALDLLAKLPESEVRAIAKSGNVRTPIQMAARKKIVG